MVKMGFTKGLECVEGLIKLLGVYFVIFTNF